LYNAFQEQDGNPDNHWKLHHRVYKARKLNSPDGDFALLRLKQGIILASIDRKFCKKTWANFPITPGTMGTTWCRKDIQEHAWSQKFYKNLPGIKRV
ncbi:42190_t:CDS:2, partial [Gigaspora margarita]